MHGVHRCVKRIYAWPHVASLCAMRQNGAMAKQPRTKTYLREWRKTKPGRTLEVVAAHLHMSQPQLGRIERGDQPYNQDLLEALAELYGCAVADLLMRDPTRPDNIWSIWDTARPGERRLIEAAAEAIVKTGTSG
jgi:transcriptional regulator with XRE-family HTH domain